MSEDARKLELLDASRKSILKLVLSCPALERQHTQVWIPSTNSKWLVTCPGGCTSPSYCWENKQLERAKRPAEKSLTLVLYQTPEDPMAPTFNYFHCSQDNSAFAFLQCLEAKKFRTSLYKATHEHRSHPRRVSSSVQQPKALLVTSWTHCCHWGCCLCLQQGLGFHPLWLQRVTVFPLINIVAIWGRPIFQNGVVLLKNIKSCQEQWRTVNALLSRAYCISNRFNENMAMERTMKN